MRNDLTNMFYPWERREVRREKSELAILVFLVLMVAFLVALVVDIFNVTPAVALIETAHASEVIEIHQNDYYCKQWRGSGVQVLGANDKEVDALCKKWGE